MADYKVKFEVFEGPLDLLLYLIKKEEVDIYQVNLTKLATQFIEYVEMMRQLDLEVAGEFLVMASTLMYIKSRELLPKDQQATPDGEEDEEDPRWELIRQLVEYKKFKDAAAQLQWMEVQQEGVYPRVPPKPDIEGTAQPPKAVASVFDLLNAVNVVLKRFSERQETRELLDDKWTVSEKIEYLRQRILEKPVLKFSELFADVTSRMEIVVTFLALLELIRLRVLIACQAEEFGEIEIMRAQEHPATAAPSAGSQEAPLSPLPRPTATVTDAPPSAAPAVVIDVQPPAVTQTPPPSEPPTVHLN